MPWYKPTVPALTPAQIRAKNNASGAYGSGNWTGESGSWEEPGTYSGNLAANPQYSHANANAVSGGTVPQGNYNSYLYELMGGANPTTGGPAAPANRIPAGATSGGGSGGGGGGAAGIGQDQLDWLAGLLGAGRPQQMTAGTPLALPDYNAPQMTPFDPSMYDNLRTQLGTAVASDKSAANTAYGDLTNYLNSNYTNAFNGPTAQTGNAPGQSQDAMRRMLEAQGQSGSLNQPARSDAGGADAAFGNLLAILGANQGQQQQNKLANVGQQQAQTNRGYDMAQLQGNTGIGLQQGAAKTAWQQAADQRAYDSYNTNYANQANTATQNWQRGNTVSDTNVANANSYTNTELSALIALLPQLRGLNLPGMAQLGLGQ